MVRFVSIFNSKESDISKLHNVKKVRHQYLYRIMPLKHIVDLFETKELHFASPFFWDDPYERILRHPGSQSVYAQCWCKRGGSDAMWRIYSPQHTSLLIRTTKQRLLQVGARIKATSVAKFKLQEVEYLSSSSLDERLHEVAAELKTNFQMEKAMDALFVKREAFDFEHEVRAIAFLQPKTRSQIGPSLRVHIDPHYFIDSITFDPRADPEYIKVVTFYLRNSVFFSGEIQKSSLYKERIIEI